MDVHMHANPRHHYGLNGCHQIKDDGLQFLSMEEQECILFFENTIDSLDESFNDDTAGLSSRSRAAPEDAHASSNSLLNSTRTTNMTPNVLEHDIIDLVRSPTNYVMPDFQNLVVSPESHYEMKPRKDHAESGGAAVLPASSDTSEENGHHPPPGSIPTPVVIASQIAEKRGSAALSPSTLLERRRSMETKREPPVAAKPSHLPNNITMSHGGHSPSPHSIATEAVNLQERRSQMLANLPAGSHPLEGGEPSCKRIPATRSMSFKDPTADINRMQALAKLGLSGDKTASPPASNLPKMTSYTSTPNGAAAVGGRSGTANSSFNNASPISSNIQRKSSSFSASNSHPSSYEPKPRTEGSPGSFGGRSALITPASKCPVSHTPQDRQSRRNSANAEAAHPGFNNYGGKSLILHPTMKPDPALTSNLSGPHDPTDTKLNSYGGKSRIIHRPQTDVPDGPNLHQTPHSSNPRVPPPEPISSNAKAKSPHHESVHVPIVRSRPATLPSNTTPKPLSSSASFRPRPDPVPQEILSKPAPSFRNQGVTVQFSGKGTTEETRRDALRRLGLLRKTS